MMTNTTVSKLERLVSFIKSNACYATRLECQQAQQPDLFNLLKHAIRKEQHMLSEAVGINVENICKTTRQLNWVANEAEYGLKKIFKKDPSTCYAWTGKQMA